jgi:hypothetical protein
MEQNMEDITINIIKHLPQKRNLFKANFDYTPIKINPTETIENFLAHFLINIDANVDYKRTKVIECGRFLRVSKTFAE